MIEEQEEGQDQKEQSEKYKNKTKQKGTTNGGCKRVILDVSKMMD